FPSRPSSASMALHQGAKLFRWLPLAKGPLENTILLISEIMNVRRCATKGPLQEIKSTLDIAKIEESKKIYSLGDSMVSEWIKPFGLSRKNLKRYAPGSFSYGPSVSRFVRRPPQHGSLWEFRILTVGPDPGCAVTNGPCPGSFLPRSAPVFGPVHYRGSRPQKNGRPSAGPVFPQCVREIVSLPPNR